ncbi:DUF4365 domain-containing protein [Lysinibacillus xylanilyticus]|uniref:DUF4365 domain-containing protein n=1 Tax=Lysinibacillus xylanilyticus TaxID=582475 RepID=UPI003D994EAF
MEYPKRHKNHVNESKSWSITSNVLPEEWIIRQLNERDYGIDGYVEIILNNEGLVSGDVCYIQLKSTEKIKWKNGKAKLSNIKKSTVNYWLSLPAPVFIFYIDLDLKELYFCSIEGYIRRNYDKYLNSNDTMGLIFNQLYNLETKIGLINFLYLYSLEKHKEEIDSSLRTLVMHFKTYLEYILYNQGRDQFLIVEEERIFCLIDLYKLLKTLSKHTPIKWGCMDIREMYEDDFKAFGEISELHELFLTKMLVQLQKQLFEILRHYKELFTVVEVDYWRKKDVLLFDRLERIDLDALEKDPYEYLFNLDNSLLY